MIVNDAFTGLGGVHKGEGGDAVDFAWQASREVKNGGDSRVSEDIRKRTGRICDMRGYILGGLRAVEGRDMAAQVNALGDGIVGLPFEDITNFGLGRED